MTTPSTEKMLQSKSHADFRARLIAHDRLIGCFVKTPSMMIAEVLAQTDLDTLCFDAEHAPFDRAAIDASVLACRAASKPSLVRVAASTPEHILNALDCGATGVVIPHVDSPEKASACGQASRFGDGGRGYAGSTRAAGYGANSVADNLALNSKETTVIAQIEDLPALDCIEEIAAVDSIDCLFIGMMDLTVALRAESPKDNKVVSAAEKICVAAQNCNRALGIFIPNVADIPFWTERGVSLFLLGSDHLFIKQGAAALVAQAKENF